jgi:hypothetical protein
MMARSADAAPRLAEGIASSGLHCTTPEQADRAGLQSALHSPENDPGRGAVKLRVRHALGRASCRSNA